MTDTSPYGVPKVPLTPRCGMYGCHDEALSRDVDGHFRQAMENGASANRERDRADKAEALAQSQAATIAEQRAEVERLKEDQIKSCNLWHDEVLKVAAKEHWFETLTDRAEAAESALATATADYHRICEKWQAEVVRADKANAKIEKLEAVAWVAGRLCIHVDLVPYTNSMGVTLSSSVGVYEELKTALAALQEDAPHG